MILQLQTIFNAPMTVYDSDAPDTGPSVLKKILNPVVQVQSNGMTLYKTGEFYEDNSTMNILMVLGVIAGIGYGAYRIIR